MDTRNKWIICKACGDSKHISDYESSFGQIKYKKCSDCRRKYNRELKRRYRNNKRNKSLQNQKEMLHRDSSIAVVRYLIDKAGGECMNCGYSRHLPALKMIHPDSLIGDVVKQYIDEQTQSNWDDVISIYQDSFVLCLTCEREYRDKCFILKDRHKKKNNASPAMLLLEE